MSTDKKKERGFSHPKIAYEKTRSALVTGVAKNAENMHAGRDFRTHFKRRLKCRTSFTTRLKQIKCRGLGTSPIFSKFIGKLEPSVQISDTRHTRVGGKSYYDTGL